MGLNEDQAEQVHWLIVRNRDLFMFAGKKLGRTSMVTHRIETGAAKPIKQAPRRLPFGKRKTAKEEIARMYAEDIIEPSDGAWALPMVLGQKDGTV